MGNVYPKRAKGYNLWCEGFNNHSLNI